MKNMLPDPSSAPNEDLSTLEGRARAFAGSRFRCAVDAAVEELAADPIPACTRAIEFPADQADHLVTVLQALKDEFAKKPRARDCLNAVRRQAQIPILTLTPAGSLTLHLETPAFGKGARRDIHFAGGEPMALENYLLLCAYQMFTDQPVRTPDANLMNRIRKLKGTPTLRAAAKPVAYDTSAPPIRFRHPIMDRSEVSVMDLGNTMVTGASGVGKTIAMIFNLIDGGISYSCDGLKSSMLLIDPKSELKDAALKSARLAQREKDVIVIGENAPKLYAFYPKDGKSYLERIRECRALGCKTMEAATEHGSQWTEKATQFVADLVELDEAVAMSSGGTSFLHRLLKWLALPSPDTRWGRVESFLAGCTGTSEQIFGNFLVLELLRRYYRLEHLINPLTTYAGMSDCVEQLMYMTRNARPWTTPLAAAEVLGLVNFDPFPPEDEPRLDLEKACDEGRIIIYQPDKGDAHTAIARLLKTQFFEAVTHRTELKRPMFYIVDEFQRFITFDDKTGEHAFLDRCRAYRCIAVLATQSLAALSQEASANCVDAVLANCRTQIFMRNVDPLTQRRLQTILPNPRVPGLPHISAVRPLADLRVGQCYYKLNSEWGLSQYRLPAADANAVTN